MSRTLNSGVEVLKARPGMALDPEKSIWARRLTAICAVGAVFGLFSANPLLTGAGLLVLPLLFMLLWNTSEPPVLLFAATFQWVQVFVPVLTADAGGESIGENAGVPAVETAAWLGLATVLALAAGMRLGRGSSALGTVRELRKESTELAPRKLFIGYLVCLVLPSLAAGVAQAVPGLRQAFLSLTLFRWILAFIVFWCATSERRFNRVATTVLIVELVLGFGGFFSSFKTILFLAAIVVLGSEVRLTRLLRPATLLLAFCVLLTTYWQAIKVDYRMFLNQGARNQSIQVSPLDRAFYLTNRTRTLTVEEMYGGLESGIDRLGYLHFFGLTIQQVPAFVPHQGGRLWREAIDHILMPRIFFPNKPAISDSARTREFSGVRVAGEEEGTEISLGYAADCYIDFGPILMFAPILVIGIGLGWSYRWLATRATSRLMGLAAGTTLVLVHGINFGASNIKLLGGVLTTVLVLSALLMLWGRKIWSLLVEGRRPRQGPHRLER
jgi:hypothetical protein